MTLLLAAVFSSVTHAATCPWADADDVTVSATMKTVTVDGATYPVKGKVARQSFARTLGDCDASDAQETFTKWRLSRRLTNWSVVAGVLTGGTLLPVAIIPAVIAGQKQDQLVTAIESAG